MIGDFYQNFGEQFRTRFCELRYQWENIWLYCGPAVALSDSASDTTKNNEGNWSDCTAACWYFKNYVSKWTIIMH